MEKDIRNMKDSILLKRLFKYLKPYLFKFIFGLILTLLAVIIALIQPIIFKETIDTLTSPDGNFRSLAITLIIYAILVLAAMLINYHSSILLQRIGQYVIYDMRKELYLHMQSFSIDYFNNNQVGSLTTRLTSDINHMSMMFSAVIVNVIKASLSIVLILVIMFVYSTKLTLYILIIMPFILLGTIIFRRHARNQYRAIRENVSELNAFIAENLSGMKIVQIFNQEETKFEDYTRKNQNLRKNHMKQIWLWSIYRPAIYLAFMIATIICYFVGAKDVIAGTITLGTLVLMTQYINKFFEPIQQLAEQFNVIQQSFASAERVFSILDTKNHIKHTGKIKDVVLKGKIEFRNVYFAYVDETWILKDLSFVINAKESVAFVGATGAGKTTILSLISRNYDIQKGTILIDDIDILEYDIDFLRTSIGQMLQDVFMFTGTIESNITLNEEAFSLDDVKAACAYVNADKFIEKLDNSYAEEVRERGNNFSTGQRQLISFARTIIHKPNIMILDEATSNIDTETEQLIQDSLDKMMNVGTMLIVAHRLSTIQKVDKIIVLEKGEILEMGSHQELLLNKGHYHSLYELQYQD